MSTEPLRVAIASFAHVHAAAYVAALRAIPNIELLASDPHGAFAPDEHPRGAELAARLGVDYVDDYDEMFAWRPDAVIVTSENVHHRALVERAASAGVHVLCEKPLATEVHDANAMIAACQSAGVILMVAFPVRFAPQFAAMRGQITRGSIGAPFAIVGTNNGKIPVDERRWFTDPLLAGGGALVDHVVHCADLIDALTNGESATTVYAVANSILHADKEVQVETGGLVTIIYESGLIATIDCSWSQPDDAPYWGGLTLKVTGPKGSIEIAPFAERVDGMGANGPIHLSYATDTDVALLDEFLAAVRAAGPARPGFAPSVQPQPDGYVGLRTVQILDAARRSALSGRPASVGATGDH